MRSTSGGGAGGQFVSGGGFLGLPGDPVAGAEEGDASTPLTPAQRPTEALSIPLEVCGGSGTGR
jgi:hypothetical protein